MSPLAGHLGKIDGFYSLCCRHHLQRLSPAEWPIAFPVISQLRSLDKAAFLRNVGRQLYAGYQLVGASMTES
jgi:hypothetical protein